MAALLYGACFDDTVKKMNGRVMVWIHGLFTGTSERAPLGGSYSPVDPRTPSPHVRTGSYAASVMASSVYGSTTMLPRAKSGLGGGAPAVARNEVARTALLNLLLTNPDMFHSCIDQCYSSDFAIADGYFAVLAEVRHERRWDAVLGYQFIDQDPAQSRVWHPNQTAKCPVVIACPSFDWAP